MSTSATFAILTIQIYIAVRFRGEVVISVGLENLELEVCGSNSANDQTFISAFFLRFYLCNEFGKRLVIRLEYESRSGLYHVLSGFRFYSVSRKLLVVDIFDFHINVPWHRVESSRIALVLFKYAPYDMTRMLLFNCSHVLNITNK